MKTMPKNKLGLGLERLEGRSLMAGLTAVLDATSALIVNGTEESDVIFLRQVNDRISVKGVPISVKGANAADVAASQVRVIVVYGNGGNDAIYLNSESTVGQQPLSVPSAVFGGAGGDLVMGSAVTDLIQGGPGNDRLFGRGSSDIIWGDLDNDYIYGGDGNDFLSGDSGIDTIYGELGDDLLDGGIGLDKLFGDSGRDAYWDDAGGATAAFDFYYDNLNFGHVPLQQQLDLVNQFGNLVSHPATWIAQLVTPIPFPIAPSGSCIPSLPSMPATPLPSTASTIYNGLTGPNGYPAFDNGNTITPITADAGFVGGPKISTADPMGAFTNALSLVEIAGAYVPGKLC